MNRSNVVLVGFMGTGKTTVARLVARRLGLRYVSTDALVEREAGTSIRQIFATRGEAYFRQRERAVLASLEGQGGLVIDCGGGVVVDPLNRHIVRRLGRVVVLTASPQRIVERTGPQADRPLLRGRPLLARVQTLLAERAAWYGEVARHGMTVDTSLVSPQAVCEAIVARWKGTNVL